MYSKDDQGKDRDTKTHEHGTSLKRVIFCAVDDDKLLIVILA
jgi:hypothetical protein